MRFRGCASPLGGAAPFSMPKNASWRELVRKFRRLRFDGPYPGGRHLFMKRGTLKVIIPNPHHEDISRSLIAKIIRQSGISFSEWDGA